MSKTKREPLIDTIAHRIVCAMNDHGGYIEDFGIPAAEWLDFQAAYQRYFGALYSAPFDRPNLILMGIPVYPLTPVVH